MATFPFRGLPVQTLNLAHAAIDNRNVRGASYGPSGQYQRCVTMYSFGPAPNNSGFLLVWPASSSGFELAAKSARTVRAAFPTSPGPIESIKPLEPLGGGVDEESGNFGMNYGPITTGRHVFVELDSKAPSPTITWK